MNDERHEQAGRVAWEAFSAGLGHDEELWVNQRPERKARWREIARAVLAEDAARENNYDA